MTSSLLRSRSVKAGAGRPISIGICLVPPLIQRSRQYVALQGKARLRANVELRFRPRYGSGGMRR